MQEKKNSAVFKSWNFNYLMPIAPLYWKRSKDQNTLRTILRQEGKSSIINLISTRNLLDIIFFLSNENVTASQDELVDITKA